MKSAGKPRGGSVSSMARLAAQKLVLLEAAVVDDASLKTVSLRMDGPSLQVLDALAKSMRTSRAELAQELLTASIADLAEVVSSRVKVPVVPGGG